MLFHDSSVQGVYDFIIIKITSQTQDPGSHGTLGNVCTGEIRTNVTSRSKEQEDNEERHGANQNVA